ncbi:CRISPR-associated endonuclease Cas2 [Brachymonas denitrificans]|jgi:CRISPR-associated protein Cas2|uniref:CRISPR-associated endonuclease Cas2 n=1 Tax=Brachymonas denitrificans TaxID=28220 RepID=UPI000B86B60A|nr:CRISPR-associated endonuclease Cas2 [Brachymonas denitrificans]
MMVLVSYDVRTSDPGGARRLRRIARVCQNYGQRVQFSVFELHVDPALWAHVRQQLCDLIDESADSLRFYHLGAKWHGKVEHVGAKATLDLEGPLVL